MGQRLEMTHAQFIAGMRSGEVYLKRYPSWSLAFFVAPSAELAERFAGQFQREKVLLSLLWGLRGLSYYAGLFMGAMIGLELHYRMGSIIPTLLLWLLCYISNANGIHPSDRLYDEDDTAEWSQAFWRLKTAGVCLVASSLQLSYPDLFGRIGIWHYLIMFALIPLPMLLGRKAYAESVRLIETLALTDRGFFTFLCNQRFVSIQPPDTEGVE